MGPGLPGSTRLPVGTQHSGSEARQGEWLQQEHSWHCPWLTQDPGSGLCRMHHTRTRGLSKVTSSSAASCPPHLALPLSEVCNAILRSCDPQLSFGDDHFLTLEKTGAGQTLNSLLCIKGPANGLNAFLFHQLMLKPQRADPGTWKQAGTLQRQNSPL